MDCHHSGRSIGNAHCEARLDLRHSGTNPLIQARTSARPEIEAEWPVRSLYFAGCSSVRGLREVWALLVCREGYCGGHTAAIGERTRHDATFWIQLKTQYASGRGLKR